MKTGKKHILIIALLLITVAGYSQSIKSSYFLDKTPIRMSFNPAFQPERGYVNIPVIGAIGANIHGNSLSFDKFLFPKNGKLVPFLDPLVSSEEFLSGLSKFNSMSVDIETSVFGFGFFKGESFWRFDLGLTTTNSVNVPKSMFEFLKLGTGEHGGIYDIKNFGISNNTYFDISLGYSRPIGDKLTVGGAVKFLVGIANAEVYMEELRIEAREEKWIISSKGVLNANFRGLIFTEAESNGEYYLDDADIETSDMGIGGYGAAIDLGATYRPIEGLIVSAAVTDLGFIVWRKSANTTATSSGLFEYDGFVPPMEDGDADIDSQADVLKDELLGLGHFENHTPKVNTRMLSASFNVGAEYSILDNKIGFGLLYWGRFLPLYYEQELTVSANFRPTDWFSAALSYSFLSDTYTTFGFVLNFSLPWLNLLVGTDYMATKISPQFIPINQSALNVYLGISIPLAKKKVKKRIKTIYER